MTLFHLARVEGGSAAAPSTHRVRPIGRGGVCTWVALLLLLASVPAQATTFAPSEVIQCPGSEEVRQVLRLYSGNTFGAVFWSDGFRIAPGLPDLPAITRCESGGPIFWVASARVLGTVPYGDAADPHAWRASAPVRALTEGELLEALAQGLGDTPERERDLRMRAWWEANAAFRRAGVPPAPPGASDFLMGSPARANLEALLRLLDEGVLGDRLTKAEALRELGRLDEARALMPAQEPAEEGPRRRWALLMDRLAARDARVARFPAAR